MYAGCGRAGDFAGDPLLLAENQKMAWTDDDQDTVRALWSEVSGLPGTPTHTLYQDGAVEKRSAVSPEDVTVNTVGTIPNLAVCVIAENVDDASYDPLGSEDIDDFTEASRFENHIRDQHRVADDSLDRMELFRGTAGDEPDFDAAAFENVSALPHETAALSYPEVYKFVLRQRNKYGLLSQNRKSWRLELDADGEEVPVKPSAPVDVAIAAAGGGKFRITARYNFLQDGDYAADTWLIYLTTGGGDPDPDLDTPIEEAMSLAGGAASLDYESEAFANGTVGNVIVRTRRSGTPDVDSDNETVVGPATADTTGPDAPAESIVAFGSVAKQEQ